MNNFSTTVARSYKYRTPYHSHFISEILDKINFQYTDVPLDLLCGRGEISSHLSEYCNKVIAVDGSTAMLAESIPKKNIQYILGDVNKDDFFDIFLNQKIRHCFVGRAIHFIESHSLKKLRHSVLEKDSCLITMESGFSQRSPWLKKYRTITKSLIPSGTPVGHARVSEDTLIKAGFDYVTSIGLLFDMQLGVDSLYHNLLSRSTISKHVELTNREEFLLLLKENLSEFLNEDNLLTARISNTAHIYQ